MGEIQEEIELMDLLKDKKVQGKDLLIRVYDSENGQEGWIQFAQFVDMFLDTLRELVKEKTSDNNYKAT